MPRRIINRDDDLGILTGRIGPGDIPQVGRKRSLQALLFAQPRLGFAARRLLQQPRGQLPRHHIECRHTIDLVLIIPCADGRPMPLHPQRGP